VKLGPAHSPVGRNRRRVPFLCAESNLGLLQDAGRARAELPPCPPTGITPAMRNTGGGAICDHLRDKIPVGGDVRDKIPVGGDVRCGGRNTGGGSRFDHLRDGIPVGGCDRLRDEIPVRGNVRDEIPVGADVRRGRRSWDSRAAQGTRDGSRTGDSTLRGQSRIRYSLPPPGFSESGIHLASATSKPL